MGKELLWGDLEAIKLFSMRENPQVLELILLIHVINYSWLFKSYVKMFISRGQYAWVTKKTTASKQRYFITHQRLNKQYLVKNNKAWFEQWLVGITDGEGTFGFYYQNSKWILVYKIALSRYNLRTLHYIKTNLGIGTITKDNSKGQILIRDRKKLESVIFPIFDKYPLLTSKYFNYIKLKKAFNILNDTSLNKVEKDKLLFALKEETLPEGYISPAWNNITLPLKHNEIINLITKPWLSGFVEGEGSFYLVSKDSARIVPPPISPGLRHLNVNSNNEEIKSVITKIWLIGFVEAAGNFKILEGCDRFETEFKIYLHQDVFLLYLIKRVLRIKNNIKFDKDTNMYFLSTKNSRSISNIIKLFKDNFKGMKSLEFKLWQKANYYKDKNIKKFLKLSEISLKVKNKNNLSSFLPFF